MFFRCGLNPFKAASSAWYGHPEWYAMKFKSGKSSQTASKSSACAYRAMNWPNGMPL